jgi:polar amino acid transport system permease protein
MAVNALNPKTNDPKDPDYEMGLELTAIERRNNTLQKIKIAIVWVVLFAILSGFLLILNFDPKYILAHYQFVLAGVWLTIGISVVSVLIAAVIALLGALGRLSSNPIAQGVSGFYVSLIRGTPLLIQIYIIYLGLPQIGNQFREHGYIGLANLFTLTGLQSGILALSLNYGAYMTEIFRAGLQSIHHGQREAAEAMGMSRSQTLRRVILPQAIRIIIPDIGNQFIAMQKDSSLVSFMGLWEITYRANRLARVDTKFIEMFILAAMIYWVLTIISSWFEGRLEKNMARAYER